MRLRVKQGSSLLNEFEFSKGPIYIGRHSHSQILLPKTTVSRQHAVIFTTHEGETILQDLNSANGTFVNGKPIHKVEIQSGDVITITEFTIEIDLKEKAAIPPTMHFDDTLMGEPQPAQIISRRLDGDHAPDITMPAERLKDFAVATKSICQAHGPDATLQSLLQILLHQFHAHRAWAALREGHSGPMTSYTGKTRNGRPLALGQLELRSNIDHAVETGEFMLLPRNPDPLHLPQFRSAMIAPILEEQGSVGVMYLDNTTDHEQYNIRDLDYLMLLAIHTAAVLENF